jgi:hypothetical protein
VCVCLMLSLLLLWSFGNTPHQRDLGKGENHKRGGSFPRGAIAGRAAPGIRVAAKISTWGCG